MVPTKEQVAAAKVYMKVDGSEDDALISSLYSAAVEYLKKSGIDPHLEDAQYLLAVHGLTLYYYDHRDDVGSEAAFPVGLRPVINQMKQTGGGVF